SRFKGMIPVEMFGQIHFPSIGEWPYFITLGPHAFYWFKLEAPKAMEARAAPGEIELPRFEVSGTWDQIFQGRNRSALERSLPAYLQTCRWFGGKARQIRSVKLLEAVPFSVDSSTVYFTALETQYLGGTPETYFLPLGFASGDQARETRQNNPGAVLAQLRVNRKGGKTEGVLYDALSNAGFCKALLESTARRRRFKGPSMEVSAVPSRVFRKIRGGSEARLEPSLLRREQSNTSVIFGDKFILKMFRRLTEGQNPDLEIGRFITEKTRFTH
ncbi:MAG: alpha-amylase, partial [Armatimonadetes bacterium]|nr:alpha-amylase [Armatimonadota bacterium]NIM67621.1 alpha-amylase [Armatimonadota bacterium]NIN06214.1 alpha-amylase [Armatimonadota bacterium]NIO97162.1 alpha-amylase [Armatimonadota bacterium]NIT32085.1 alpha-amylase [Armatimonadota bacterium]